MKIDNMWKSFYDCFMRYHPDWDRQFNVSIASPVFWLQSNAWPIL